ncbi:MAG: tRNA (N6-threonylcarbamoyladenosine(37)-N6)-methyltransferase TrmO [Clostridia bacterium]|nr:tRNA (N6-threonylcarbamoyladenosine(37)-N6)-methyltransferase TrmO [Clostridia bacterium]
MRIIARIHTEFPAKFGIPRQSGLVNELTGRVVFEEEYRVAEAFRGLEGFSHIWLIWQFSEAVREDWSPTVKPPRLGGNRRMGVFATRSPFRPNPIGLSCVRLEKVDFDAPDGPVLLVRGADLMDNTPIYDVKPYLPYADCHPEASSGFTGQTDFSQLTVEFSPALLERLPEAKREAAVQVLAQDPRPGYKRDDAQRRYGVAFAGFDLRFTVSNGVLRVCEVVPLTDPESTEDNA